MSPYTFSLALGAVGLAAMAVAGLGSHMHDSASGHGNGHGAHHHGDSHGHHGDGHGHHGDSHGHHDHHEGGSKWGVFALLSPRLWFTFLVGFGATGLLVPSSLGGTLRFGAAIAGAILFERLLARPLWNLFFQFASKPALTLESCVEDEVQAVTSFDPNGHGLVALELDGQIVQVLATLRPADRAAGIRVRAGDKVRIEEVDAGRNRCVVAALSF